MVAGRIPERVSSVEKMAAPSPRGLHSLGETYVHRKNIFVVFGKGKGRGSRENFSKRALSWKLCPLGVGILEVQEFKEDGRLR